MSQEQWEQARAQRDEALAAVEAASSLRWRNQTYIKLVLYLRHHHYCFVDDFWDEVELEPPRESRALGPVFLRAASAGLMVKSGEFRKSVRSNLTEKPVWRSLTCRSTS